MLLGYDLGIIAGAIIPIEDEFDLNHWEVEILVSCIIFFSVAGALIAGTMADWVIKTDVCYFQI